MRRLRQRLDAGDASLVADPGGWAAWILIVASFTLCIPPDDGQRIVRLRQARVSGSYAAECHDLFDFPSGRLRRASDSLLRIGSRAMSERLGAADATNADTRTKPWFPWIRLIERSFTDPGLDSVAGLVADSL